MAASTGAAVTGSEFLAQTAARASTALSPHGSNGIKHVVVLMMENRSFDHFLGWLSGADGRHDLTYRSTDGNYYRNYPLAPDFQGCGYSDPDHSWEGFLVQRNFGRMDGFLQRPTAPADNLGVTLAQANTFPIGYYTNLNPGRTRKAVPDLPVIGALAEHYTVLDRYFCSFAGETFPNRFYQHAARTDRDHNSFTISVLPTIWDQLSPIPNNQGIPTGGYFFRDLPYLALWGTKYFPFWHPFADGDTDALGIPVTTPSFIDTVAQGNLPNVSFVDPAFNTEGNGTSADDHPLADIRLGERFIADAYHALASAGYLDNTVLVVTFDEWGGFYDHVLPPRVIDDTNPADVDHTGDGTTPTDGQLVPDYRQLGFRVPSHPGIRTGPPPGGPPRTVRAHVHPQADRDHVRAALAHGQGRPRPEPGPGPGPGPAEQGPGQRYPHQQPGTRTGQRSRGDLQRGQRPVGFARPGPEGQAPGVPAAVLAAGVADGFRDGRVRQSLP